MKIKRSFRLKIVFLRLDGTSRIAEVGYAIFVLSICSSLAMAEELPSDYAPGEPTSSNLDLKFSLNENLAANIDDLSVTAVSSALG